MKDRLVPVLTALLFLVVGCVDINQNVQIARPSDTNLNQVATLKCPLRPYPFKLIKAQGAGGSQLVRQGPTGCFDQASFDTYWSNLTIDPTQEAYTTVQGTTKPQIDWTTQQVLFVPVGQVDNTCKKFAPVRVDTDCLQVTVWMLSSTETTNCESISSYPVFVYVLSKTTLPVNFQWDQPSTPTPTPSVSPEASTPTPTATPTATPTTP